MNTPYHTKALPEGTILREWKLEKVLGVGGFGIVYLARGVYFDELVAIKEYFPGAISDRHDGTTVTPTDSSSEEVYSLGLEKFLEEAKVLWNLSKPERHPNIVSVRSLFEIHGTAYMVMDFESGLSLSQMLRDGRTFDEASLLGLIRPIAEGLDRAHRAGVLHRDIKPANILVDNNGRPVLIDFGSARFEHGQATSTNVTFYTPPYAALEQYVKTYPQGPWTDIYALGVAMYQCVTGEKPPEVLERLHGGLGERLSERNWPGYSRNFTRAVDAAMGIRPVERPQSIPEWLAMFDGVAPAPPPAVDDDATRVVAFRPTQSAAATAGASQATPASAAQASSPSSARSRALRAAIAVVVLGLIGLGGAVLVLWPHPAPVAAPPKPVAAPVTVAAAPTTPNPTINTALITQDAEGLIADARRIGGTRAEIAALTASKAKIDAVVAQLQALPPGSGAKAAPLVVQLNGVAVEMSRNEAGALDDASTSQMRELGQSVATSPAQSAAIAALRGAKANLNAAIAAVPQTGDAIPAIDAARQALTAYTAFLAADRAAGRFALIAKQKKVFDTLDATARRDAAQVASLAAAAAKPWLLAAKARKDAYKLLQDNAVRSKADLAQLDQLGAAARAASDLGGVSAVVSKADQIKTDLDRLYASSYAASKAAAG